MLQTPRWLPLALLLALVPLVGWVFARTNSPVTPSQELVSAPAEAADDALPKGGTGVVATVFHGSARCPSCVTLEEQTRETLKALFPKELASGKLVFRSVNAEAPEHQHYIEDYRLTSISLVVARFEKGTRKDWKTLQDVWRHLRDPESFRRYVGQETGRMLKL